jgi:hypothetical protein
VVTVDIEVVVAAPVRRGLHPTASQWRRRGRGEGKSVWRDYEHEAMRHMRAAKIAGDHGCGLFGLLIDHHTGLESGG